MRRISAAVAGVLVLTALTACSGTGATECDIAAGNASGAVRATGAVGSAPEVSFPTPLISRSLETSVIEPGTGELLHDGQPVLIEATILSGADGSVGEQTGYAGFGSLFTVGSDTLPALGEALECASIGSRISVVAAADYGDAAGGVADATSVYVVDVLAAFPSRAWGADQLPLNGMPSVVSAPDGTPGVTVPNQDAPTKFRAEVLKRGDGPLIEADDLVVAKYTAVDWDTGRVSADVPSTWETGSATVIPVTAAQIGAGLAETIEGKTVGSRVVSVAPPEGGVARSLIYVVDILGTVG